jgi:hypothetical protein
MAQNAASIVASVPGTDRSALTDVNQELEEMRRRARASYPMAALGLVALVAAALVFKLPELSSAVMGLAAIVPAMLAPTSLIFGWLLLLAALFAFLAKPRGRVAAAVA